MPNEPDSDLSRLAWLAWQVDSGADEAIEERPLNRLAAPRPASGPAPDSRPEAVRPAGLAEPQPGSTASAPAAQAALWQAETPGLASTDAGP
jgi:hypothetical protein